MIRVSIPAFVTFAAALSAVAISGATPVNAAKVTTEEAVCNSAKTRVAAVRHFEISAIAFCDIIVEEAQPEGFYVLALHGRRADCDGICSTNMGWFAIQKTTGRVFEWDIAEWQLGQPI